MTDKDPMLPLTTLLHDDLNVVVDRHTKEWEGRGLSDDDIYAAIMQAMAVSSSRIVAWFSSGADDPQDEIKTLSNLLVKEIIDNGFETLARTLAQKPN
jgi:hypothetical protein